MAVHLAEAGCDVVLLERRGIGTGSTSASTALLQYEIDTPLTELARCIGPEGAKQAYLGSLHAITKIGQLAADYHIDCGFSFKKSLYVANTPEDAALLEREYAARKAIGIEIDLLSRAAIQARFPSFEYPAALLSYQAAQADPFALAHGLMRAAQGYGARLHDHTSVRDYHADGSGVVIETENGPTVRAGWCVFATGYEGGRMLGEQHVQLTSSYALMSQPLAAFPGWGEDQCQIWETASPYLYMRTTADGRVLLGGEDEPFADAAARDALIPAKTARLLERFHAMFPRIRLEVSTAWAGTFAETPDGLPYIGAHPAFPRGFFALGYGGNGITYSLIAAEILRDQLLGRPRPDAQIYGFERAKLKRTTSTGVFAAVKPGISAAR